MMIQYKVEKKVPMPQFKDRGVSRYPFDQMDVGDSFFVPTVDVASMKSLRQTTYNTNRKKAPRAFKMSIEANGFRIFRVK